MRQITILVMSTTASEHHAIVKNIAIHERYVHKNEAYLSGTLNGWYHDFQVILCEPGKHPTDLLGRTQRAIRLFQPHLAFLLGLATGTGNLALESVLISNQILTQPISPDHKKKAPSWMVGNTGKEFLRSLNVLDADKHTANLAPSGALQQGKLVSNEGLIPHATPDKNQPELLAVAPLAEAFFQALQTSPDVPGLALMGINKRLEAGDGKSQVSEKAVDTLILTAINVWRRLNCKEYLANDIECKYLAQDVFSRLFPFPEAVREIDNDFSTGFNKNYHEVWNMVKPFLTEEIGAFQNNPRDRDNQTGVQEKLRRAFQEKKQLRQSLGTLLKQVTCQQFAP